MVHKKSNSLHTKVVTDGESFQSVMLLRAICFMEMGLSRKQAIDGNDFQATHFLMLDGEEPVGACRIRWFHDFAQMERTCFRDAYRDPRLMKKGLAIVFEHVARKGYDKVYTHAEARFVPLWKRFMGFHVVEGRKPHTYGNIQEPLIEMVQFLDPGPDAICETTDPTILMRVEGAWDYEHALEA